MQDHVRGRKHQQLLKLVERQRQRADRSIYVRGFQPGTSAEKLRNHFSNFGKVQDVFLDRVKGSFAIVSYDSKNSAEYLLGKAPIYMGRKRLTVRPKEVKVLKPRETKKDVSQKQREAEEAILDAEAVHNLLMSKLISCKDVSEQMALLQQELQLTDEDIRERLTIQQMLQSLFEKFIPGCRVHLFGSSVNGFGVRGCDLDLFLDLNLDDDDDNEDNSTQKDSADQTQSSSHHNDPPYLSDIRGIKVEDGVVCRASLREATLQARIKLVGRILCNDGGPFKETFTIANARCPVVKTVHTTSGLHCDLSINNRLALKNTLLIQHLTSLDPRIRPLTYTLRYWFKWRELAGNPKKPAENSGPRLTNYALMMLVFFYLQNLERPLLPAVHYLADMAEASEHDSIEGWDCTFSTDRTRWQEEDGSNTNTSSLSELLVGFFKFYSSFELSCQVICPRTGKTVDLDYFREMMACDSKLTAFKMSAMCLQDPFVLDHNIASNVNEKTKLRLINELSQACEQLAQAAFGQPSEDNWGLALLLSDTKPQGPDPAPLQHIHDIDSFEYSFPISMKAYHFSEGLFHSSLSTGCSNGSSQLDNRDVREKWCWNMISLVKKILEDVLYFNVSDKTSHSHGEQEHTSGKQMSEQKQASAQDQETSGNQQKVDQQQMSQQQESQQQQGMSTQECVSQPSMEQQTPSQQEHVAQVSESEQPKQQQQQEQGQVYQQASEMLTQTADMDLGEMSLGDNKGKPGKRASPCSEDSGKDFKRSRCETDTPIETGEKYKQGIAEATQVTHTDAQVSEDDMNDKSQTYASDACIPPLGHHTVVGLSSGKQGSLPLSGHMSTLRTSGDPQTKDSSRLLSRSDCSTRYRMWNSRKKIRKTLKQSEPAMDVVDLEVKVSKLLEKGQEQCSSSVVEFDFFVFNTSSAAKTSVLVCLRPTKGLKEFTCFFPFLESFITKLVDKQ